MARKAVLIRIDERLHKELRAWAQDLLRSLNGQIEFVLREAVERHRKALPDGESEKKRKR